MANCIEGTARFGMELGYHVTLVKEATAAFEPEGMHAAHEVNGSRVAHAILTSDELLALLPATSAIMVRLGLPAEVPG